MFNKLPNGSTLKGFLNADLNVIFEVIDMLTNNFTILDTDEVLKEHCNGIVNRIFEIADIPECNGKVYEIYSAVIESDDIV